MRHALTIMLLLAAAPAAAQCPPYCGPGVMMPVPDPNWPPPNYTPEPRYRGTPVMPVIPPETREEYYARQRQLWDQFNASRRGCDPRFQRCRWHD